MRPRRFHVTQGAFRKPPSAIAAFALNPIRPETRHRRKGPGPAAQSGGPDPEVGGTPPGPGLACSPGMAPPMTSPLAAEEHLSQYRADEVVWHLATFTHSDCGPERYASRPVEPPPDSGESPSRAAALSLRIFGRTCGLIGSASKSARQRSGGISGESEPNRTLSCSSVFADW